MTPTPRNNGQRPGGPYKRPGNGRKNTTAKKKMTLSRAVKDEIRDDVQSLTLSANIEKDDIVRGVLLAVLIIFFSVLETTFFVRFAPFGAVPDLMLILSLAVGFYEGEKWGAVTGLICAFVIDALGSPGFGPHLLPLVYMPIGCAVGLLNKYYLSNTFAIKAVYIGSASAIKAVYNCFVTRKYVGAPMPRVLIDVVIPEFFSTLLVSFVVMLLVWLTFKRFHKSRAERTADTVA